MHALQVGGEIRCERLRVDPEDAVRFPRPAHPPGPQIPFPVAEPRDALRARQPRFAFAQFVQRALGAQHVAQAVAKNEEVDRLGGEVGGPGLVGGLDRFGVVEPREDQDRRVRAAWNLPHRRAGLETVHLRHPDVHDDELGLESREGLHPLRAVAGLGHGELEVLQRLPHQVADRRVVVDDEDQGFRLTLSVVAHDRDPWLRLSRAATTRPYSASMSCRSTTPSPSAACRARASTFLHSSDNRSAPIMALLDLRL